jgi:REP element-mobilizing transposase RayT
MTYDPSRHHRRSIRLKGYDYSRPGAYFITIVAQDRACLFGKVVDGVMHLSEVGQIIAESWQWLAAQYDYVTLDAWVVMPNHIHGIIVITDQGGDDGGRGGDNGGGGGNNGGRGGNDVGGGGNDGGRGGDDGGGGGNDGGRGGDDGGRGGDDVGGGGNEGGRGGDDGGRGGDDVGGGGNDGGRGGDDGGRGGSRTAPTANAPTTSNAPTAPDAPTANAPTTSNAPTAPDAPTVNAPTAPDAPTVNAPTAPDAPTVNAPTANAPTVNAPTANAPTVNAPTTNAPTAPAKRKTVGRLVGAFKTVSTKRINDQRGTPGAQVWQRDFYEHIIRDAAALARIRRYIVENPARWASDPENRGC